MRPPPGSFAPWQVLTLVVVLLLVLCSAVALAAIQPLAVTGLVPLLGATSRLLPALLGVRDGDSR